MWRDVSSFSQYTRRRRSFSLFANYDRWTVLSVAAPVVTGARKFDDIVHRLTENGGLNNTVRLLHESVDNSTCITISLSTETYFYSCVRFIALLFALSWKWPKLVPCFIWYHKLHSNPMRRFETLWLLSLSNVTDIVTLYVKVISKCNRDPVFWYIVYTRCLR